jgi:hypothetical protein
LVQLIGPGKTLSEYQKHHSYASFKDHVKLILLERYNISRRIHLIQEGTIAKDDDFPFENIIQSDCKEFKSNYQVGEFGKKRLALLIVNRALVLLNNMHGSSTYLQFVRIFSIVFNSNDLIS